MRTTTSLLLAIVLLASCNQFEKAPSGMTYKITSGGTKEKVKQGQFLKLHIEYKLKSKDSVLQSSYGRIPVYFPLDTANLGKHTFTEIITQCASGDKVEFVLFLDTLKRMQMIDYNEMFKQGDMINGRFEILKVFNTQDEAKADIDKEMEIEKQREITEVKDYAKKKNMKVVSTASGVQVEILNPGTGQKADSGWQASVLYKGYFTQGKKDGEVFDTNMNPNGPNNQPYPVVVGSRSVIPGWDEALRLFGKGGKGRIIVPAWMAYGQQGSAPVIPPYSNLGFDIEVVDVTKPIPQPQQANPGAPQQR